MFLVQPATSLNKALVYRQTIEASSFAILRSPILRNRFLTFLFPETIFRDTFR